MPAKETLKVDQVMGGRSPLALVLGVVIAISVLSFAPICAGKPPPAKVDAAKQKPALNDPSEVIEIEVGHAHVLHVPSARQVAVGNSQTLQANPASASEVILFGKQAGSTTVDVWDNKGRRRSYQVKVQAAGKMQTLAEIRSLLAGIGDVTVDSTGNHILVHANRLTTAQRQIVERILARYPEVVDLTANAGWDPMVMLDVLVVELPTHRLVELGVRWETSEGSGGYAGAAWQAGVAGGHLNAALSGADGDRTAAGKSATGWIGFNGLLTSKLHAMAERGEAVLLAQPQLVTRSGKAASFLAGGEVPYAMTDSKGRSHTEFKKYGVSLVMTPELGANGQVTASIEVEVSAVDTSISTPAGPAMRVRKASTQFNVQSGQTMVLAGFMSSERAKSYRGAPGSGAGVFQRLLGVQEDRLRQTELAILVTPVVLDANHDDIQDRSARARAYADLEMQGRSRLVKPLPMEQESGSQSVWDLDQYQNPINSTSTGLSGASDDDAGQFNVHSVDQRAYWQASSSSMSRVGQADHALTRAGDDHARASLLSEWERYRPTDGGQTAMAGDDLPDAPRHGYDGAATHWPDDQVPP